MSFVSSSVGFWPRLLMTYMNDLVDIVPSAFLSYIANASFTSIIWRNCSWWNTDWTHHYYSRERKKRVSPHFQSKFSKKWPINHITYRYSFFAPLYVTVMNSYPHLVSVDWWISCSGKKWEMNVNKMCLIKILEISYSYAHIFESPIRHTILQGCTSYKTSYKLFKVNNGSGGWRNWGFWPLEQVSL